MRIFFIEKAATDVITSLAMQCWKWSAFSLPLYPFHHVSWDSLLIILAAQAHPDTGSNFKEAWHQGSLTVGMSMYRSHMVTCLLHMLTIKLMGTICKHVMPKVEIYAATNCSTYG